MSLPDPRQYPPVNARNPIIRQLMSMLTEHDENLVAAKRAKLVNMITDLLIAKDHAAINAALTQAPAQDAWQSLWQILCEVVSKHPENCDIHTTLFALPIIVVAASSQECTVPGILDNPDQVLQILRQHGVLAQDAEAVIAPGLVSAEAMAAFSPAILYQWKSGAIDTFRLDQQSPLNLPASPIRAKEESAWLRFIVGAVCGSTARPAPIRLGGLVEKWGLELSQALGEQLKTANATVLAIPRAPQGWQEAQQNGRTVLLETRLQLTASSAIRAIRAKGCTPVAVIAAHENDEIRITFSSQEDAERWLGFVWPLSPADRVEHIQQFALMLLRDCQVYDVRVIDTLQPDREGDLPFFVTAHFAPVSHH